VRIDLHPVVEYEAGRQRHMLYLESNMVNYTKYLTDVCYLHDLHKLTNGEVLELVSGRVLQATRSYLSYKELQS